MITVLLENGVSLLFSWFAGQLVNDISSNQLILGMSVKWFLIFWFLVISFQCFLRYSHQRTLGIANEKLSAELRNTVFSHILSLSLNWHDSRKRGAIVSHLIRHVDSIASFFPEQ